MNDSYEAMMEIRRSMSARREASKSPTAEQVSKAKAESLARLTERIGK